MGGKDNRETMGHAEHLDRYNINCIIFEYKPLVKYNIITDFSLDSHPKCVVRRS